MEPAAKSRPYRPALREGGRFDPLAVATLKQSFIDMKTLRSEPTDAELFTTQFVPIKR